MKAAETFPSYLALSDDSHSARLVLKHVQQQIKGIDIYGDKSAVSSCNAIVEMKGSVSLQHLMWQRNTFYLISAQSFIKKMQYFERIGH